MTQKELRKKYMQIIKTEVYPCSREMQEFSKRRCGYIVELTDGKIIRLYKPRKHVPYDFTEIMDKITRLTLCLEGFAGARHLCSISHHQTIAIWCKKLHILV